MAANEIEFVLNSSLLVGEAAVPSSGYFELDIFSRRVFTYAKEITIGELRNASNYTWNEGDESSVTFVRGLSPANATMGIRFVVELTEQGNFKPPPKTPNDRGGSNSDDEFDDDEAEFSASQSLRNKRPLFSSPPLTTALAVWVLRRPPIPDFLLEVDVLRRTAPVNIATKQTKNDDVEEDEEEEDVDGLYGESSSFPHRQGQLKSTVGWTSVAQFARSYDRVGPRGGGTPNLLLPSGSAPTFAGLADDVVVRIRVTFEERSRQHVSIFEVPSADRLFAHLKVYDGAWKLLKPISVKHQDPASPTAKSNSDEDAEDEDDIEETGGGASTLTASGVSTPTDPATAVEVLMQHVGSLGHAALMLVQHKALARLQVHVRDGFGQTIFLEEEEYVPYMIRPIGKGPEPQHFGWYHGLSLMQPVAGNRFSIVVRYDTRDADWSPDRCLQHWVNSVGGDVDGLVPCRLGGSGSLTLCLAPTAPTKKTLFTTNGEAILGRLPWSMVLSTEGIRAVPFIRDLEAPLRAAISGQAKSVSPHRALQENQEVLLAQATVFLLLHPEDPHDGTKWHLLTETLHQYANDSLPLLPLLDRQGCARDFEILAPRMVQTLVMDRWAQWQYQYGVINKTHPWISNTVDADMFTRTRAMVSILMRRLHATPGAELFLPPYFHLVGLGGTRAALPNVELRLDTERDELHLVAIGRGDPDRPADGEPLVLPVNDLSRVEHFNVVDDPTNEDDDVATRYSTRPLTKLLFFFRYGVVPLDAIDSVEVHGVELRADCKRSRRRLLAQLIQVNTTTTSHQRGAENRSHALLVGSQTPCALLQQLRSLLEDHRRSLVRLANTAAMVGSPYAVPRYRLLLSGIRTIGRHLDWITDDVTTSQQEAGCTSVTK